MQDNEFPSLLARVFIGAAPRPALDLGAAALLAAMGRNHPHLFAVLAEQRQTRVLVELTDPPRRFLLQYGGGPPTLRVAEADVAADAELKGGLEAMMALLEARVDGDALFFTRELTVSGDTAAVVTLRNILDRETISVLDEASSLFGPLRRMARVAILNWERRATRLRAALAPPAASGERAGMGEAEAAELREQIEGLKARLSKLEAHQRRKEGAAA
ncbi:MAG: SCP2 sterol-binding domain-containing protein [Roseiarcus sp.]|jgi:predicted lipid carrier protein YhbT